MRRGFSRNRIPWRPCPPHLISRHRHFSTLPSSSSPPSSILVNGRSYLLPPPGSHTVALLLDGSSIDYLHAASLASLMPHYNAILSRQPSPPTSPLPHLSKHSRHYLTTPSPTSGLECLASACMPTFTNPNNVSVVTGVPPRTHGITGNYMYDSALKKEVMMDSPHYIRCPTILEGLHQAGVDVTVITVKHKLKGLLTKGLQPPHPHGGKVTSLSIERLQEADEAALRVDMSGVIRDIYHPLCSISALRLGAALIRRNLSLASPSSPAPPPPHVYYFSTTDYVQHKAAPGEALANEFYAALDGVIGELHGMGVGFGLTADHGMGEKAREDGTPRVVWVGDVVKRVCKGGSRVVLPITDPHVRHHGALGGYAVVYVEDEEEVGAVMRALRAMKGVYTVMGREEAVGALELDGERIGDVVVLAGRDWVLGGTEENHREGLREVRERGGRLRSHGGLDEMEVPLMVSRPVVEEGMRKRMMQGKLRNFDLFDVLLNGTRPTPIAPSQT